MRFWLASFVLVFAVVELFDWFAALGSWHPTGLWLVLGGVGLAALSNLGSNLSSTTTPAENSAQGLAQSSVENPTQNKATGSDEPVAQVAAGKGEKAQPQPTADKDAVSFKIRPLKR